jgi:hypothetical protein
VRCGHTQGNGVWRPLILVKPLVRRVGGEKIPNIIDLTRKLQKFPRPLLPKRRVAATCICVNGRVELEHDGESLGEARARRGGPKHRRSTSQVAKEPISHAHWCDSHPQNRRRRLRPEQAGEASGRERSREDDPTTVDLLPRSRETQN